MSVANLRCADWAYSKMICARVWANLTMPLLQGLHKRNSVFCSSPKFVSIVAPKQLISMFNRWRCYVFFLPPKAVKRIRTHTSVVALTEDLLKDALKAELPHSGLHHQYLSDEWKSSKWCNLDGYLVIYQSHNHTRVVSSSFQIDMNWMSQ